MGSLRLKNCAHEEGVDVDGSGHDYIFILRVLMLLATQHWILPQGD